jgi:hypothetical protein
VKIRKQGKKKKDKDEIGNILFKTRFYQSIAPCNLVEIRIPKKFLSVSNEIRIPKFDTDKNIFGILISTRL